MPLKGYKQTEEHRLKNKNRPNGRLGKLHSDETKKKMSKSRRLRPSQFTKEEAKRRVWERNKIRSRNHRAAALAALGGKCVRCGFEDSRALQIDHINGGGTKEREERGFKGNYDKHVLQSFLNGENKYQLLCANCNWIKRSEMQEHRVYGKIKTAPEQNSR